MGRSSTTIPLKQCEDFGSVWTGPFCCLSWATLSDKGIGLRKAIDECGGCGWSRLRKSLPTAHGVCPAKDHPTMGRPVKEFSDSHQGGWTPSEERTERGGANPCWIMALHMGQLGIATTEEEGCKKAGLLYWVGRMATIHCTYSASYWSKGSELS